MNLGKRFKFFRKEAGLKQKEAAELIGIKPYQLANYENNRSEPNIATLKRMSKIYKVTIDGLVANLNQFQDKPLIFESIDVEDLSNKLKEVLELLDKESVKEGGKENINSVSTYNPNEK